MPLSPYARVPASPTPNAADADRRRRLRALQTHLALWTAQVWLALFFAGAAYAKLTVDLDLLTTLLGWPEDADLPLVRLVGGVELTLAAGMLAPLVAGRAATMILTAATVGLFGMSGFGLALHLSRGEVGYAGLNLALLALTLFVLFGRVIASPRTRA